MVVIRRSLTDVTKTNKVPEAEVSSQNFQMAIFEQCCCCKQRHLIVFLIALSQYQGSSTRNMLIHIVQLMVIRPSSNASLTLCNMTDPFDLPPYIDKRGTNYGWDKTTDHRIVHFFYVGFAVSHIPGGYFGDKYGGRHMMSCIIISVAIIQFITPPLIHSTHGGAMTLDTLRFIHGVIEGMRIPVCNSLLAHWVPRRERARMMCLSCIGMFLGVVSHHMLLMPMVRKYRDWALPFYISGSLGSLLSFIWLLAGASYPTTSSYIKPVEKFFLQTELKHKVDHKNKTVPVKKILLSVRVLALCFGMTGHLWSWHFSQMFAKTYMRDVLNFDIADSKIYTTVPYIMMSVVCVFSGFISDWAINNDMAEKTFLRKMFSNVALMGGPIYMLVGSYSVCHVNLAQALFILSMSFEGCAFAGIRIVPLDLSANYAGFLTGLAWTPGTLLLAFAPELAEILIPESSVMGYRRMFLMTLGLCTVSCLVFVLLGDAKTQEWNTVSTKQKNKRR